MLQMPIQSIPLNSQQNEVLRDATSSLQGMVVEAAAGQLVFREASQGEKALNRAERREIARCFALGVSDSDIARELTTW